MKKAVLLMLLLVSSIAAGLSASNWQEQRSNDSPRQSLNLEYPRNAKTELIEKQPVDGILPILGESDNLNNKQWQDMQAWRKDAESLAEKNRGLLYINGDRQQKRVALTFDDGPDAKITPQIIDILKEQHVPAAFFVKGNQVLRYRSLIARMDELGYLIESHAYSHQELSKMNRQDIDKELKATDMKIAEVIGKKPKFMRPPFGDMDDTVLSAAKDNGQRIILWSIDTLDWSQQDPQNISNNVLANVRAGEIILMHCREGQEATVQALPLIISGLRQQGYEIVRLDELLSIPAYQD